MASIFEIRDALAHLPLESQIAALEHAVALGKAQNLLDGEWDAHPTMFTDLKDLLVSCQIRKHILDSYPQKKGKKLKAA